MLKGQLFILSFLLWQVSFSQKVKFWKIPEQTINFSELYNAEVKDSVLKKVSAFEVSPFITLKQYKSFLNAVKTDTSFHYSDSLLIDSSICSDSCYSEYISNKSVLNHSVVGVSWQSALAFCKYKTIQENDSNTIEFLYRLITIEEWGSMYKFLGKKSDQNKLYSYWTLDNFEESSYGRYLNSPGERYEHILNQSYRYMAEEADPPVLHRKRIIGQSFDHQASTIEFSYRQKYAYSFTGYKDLGFRIVKVQKDDFLFDLILTYWRLD